MLPTHSLLYPNIQAKLYIIQVDILDYILFTKTHICQGL